MKGIREFNFTAPPRDQINPIYHCALIRAMSRGWPFLGGGPVAQLLLWALQERDPVRCCEINPLPRGSAPPPQGRSRDFVTTPQINPQHWPKLCPGGNLSVIEHHFIHI
jgi:hypothetical protein